MATASVNEDAVLPGWSEQQGDCRLVFEENAQPMWVYSAQGIVDVNRAALLHYDFSRDEFLALSVDDFEITESLSKASAGTAEGWSRRAASERVLGRHRKRDGSPIDVEISSFAITFGGLPATLRSISDVTSLARTAAQARTLDLLLATVADTVFVKDEAAVAAGWNGAVESTFGRRAADVLGPVGALAFAVDVLSVQRADAIQRLLSTGRFHGELTHRQRDGKRVRIEICAVAMFDSGGAHLGYVSVSRDVSDRRRAEDATRALFANVVTTQEMERQRVARELDEGVAQTLSSVLVGLRTVGEAHDLSGAREAAGALCASVSAVIEAVEHIASGLGVPLPAKGPASERRVS
jgi:PAS domain S-box-containing protein